MPEPIVFYAAGSKAVLSSWVPENLAVAVQKLARANDRSVSVEVRRAVSRYVEAETQKSQTQESVTA